MVNLELYRVFVAVADCGSLTKAAKKLYISQPAVSQSVKLLETQLGGQLFLRTNKGMQLTESGAKIYGKVKQALELFDEAQRQYGAAAKAQSTLRICAADTVFTHILLDTVLEFNKAHPEVRLFLNNCMTDETVENLKNNRGDIGFVNMPLESDDVEFADTLIELNDVFVSKTSAFLDSQSICSLNDLEDYPLLMLEKATSTSRAVISFAKSVGAHLHPEIEIGSIELLKELAKKGMGIACVPYEFAVAELESGALSLIKTAPPLPTRAIGTILPKGKTPPVVEQFLECLRKSIYKKRRNI